MNRHVLRPVYSDSTRRRVELSCVAINGPLAVVCTAQVLLSAYCTILFRTYCTIILIRHENYGDTWRNPRKLGVPRAHRDFNATRVHTICTEWWCTEVNEATQTHCYNPVAPAYPIWAYYAHGRQRRCQEDPVSLPSGRLEKTTRSSLHHVAHRPTGSETTTPYASRSSRFYSELPSLGDNVDVWRYAILELHARNDDDDD